MIVQEVLDLMISVQAANSFETHVMPTVFAQIKRYHTAVLATNKKEQDSMLDSGLLKAMLDILSAKALNTPGSYSEIALCLMQII